MSVFTAVEELARHGGSPIYNSVYGSCGWCTVCMYVDPYDGYVYVSKLSRTRDMTVAESRYEAANDIMTQLAVRTPAGTNADARVCSDDFPCDFDYDHEDEYGNPVAPPARTPAEDIAFKAKLDRELDEMLMDRREFDMLLG